MWRNRFKSAAAANPGDRSVVTITPEAESQSNVIQDSRHQSISGPSQTPSSHSIPCGQLALPPDQHKALDPLGLQDVYEPSTPIGTIIFVHGLGGSAWRTWCWDREIKNFWPHWLVEDEPFSTFRILTFGYNARFRGEATNLDIIDFAKDLLLQLDTTLRLKNAYDGPIIFIAHSMGGLVTKKAYLLGKHDKQFSKLIEKVLGIVFLATPHRGSRHAKFLNGILMLATPLGVPPKPYVADLDIQSSAISDINKNFEKQCEELSLVSFYETLKTNLHLMKTFIVAKNSAVLGYSNEISASMDADHHTICKFKDRSDPNFTKLRGLLKTWISRQTEILSRAQSMLGVQDPGASQTDLQSILSLLADSSGRWLTDKEEFQAWVCQEDTVPLTFWMIGLPGKGKTVLSAVVVNYVQSKDHQVQYCFFSQGHQNRRSIVTCLRQIAAQLAERLPAFREALVRFHEDTGNSFESETHTFQYLWETIFVGILFQLQLEKPLWWILDGIDEADNPSLLITSLNTIRSCTPIRIYLSSRPMKLVSLLDNAHLTSYFLRDSDTAHDIQAYTQNALRNEIPDDAALRNYVCEKILTNAKGSFLWVKLALETLKDNWYTRESIETALTCVPHGMVSMYETMVESINSQQPRNRQMAKLILTWVICSWRPLSLQEIETALEPEFKDFTDLAVTINQICGHFVNIEQSSNSATVLSLIHATAREFLLEAHDSSPAFIDPEEAHKTIAISCLSYLSNDRWRRYFTSFHINQSRSKQRTRIVLDDETCPLLTYAAYYWAHHVSRATTDSRDLMKVMNRFLDNYCLSWIEGIAIAGDLQYISKAAQYLMSYVNRGTRQKPLTESDQALPPKDSWGDFQWVQAWAIDLSRMVVRFGSNLLRNPPSIYKHVPALCPKESMIRKAYGAAQVISMTVEGLPSGTWDDCLGSVNICRQGYATQVLATASCFLTLANASGTVMVWGAETCQKLNTVCHAEWVTMMAVNKPGTLLATSGYRTFCVWDVSSGRQVCSFPKKSQAIVRDLKFSPDNKRLLVGLDNCTVAYYSLDSGEMDRTFVARLPEDDPGYTGCPGNVVISPDLTQVAMSWRARAPLVWDLDRGKSLLPYKCRVKGPNDPLLSPKQLLWRSNTGNLLVLCSDTRLVEWRILDEYHTEHDHIGGIDMCVSDDGQFILSMDHQGTITVWTLPGYDRIYSLLNSNDPSSAMVFSPNSRRFYDIRGSVCNVWEPEVLVQPGEQGLNASFSFEGSTAISVIKASAAGSEHPTITAIGGTLNDKYLCYGRDDGSVIIADAHSGKRLRKVYNHGSAGDVLVLAWSKLGRYMVSSDEFGQVIAKRLQAKEDGKWAVFPVFEVDLDARALQLLFSPDEKFLLISTPSKDFIWNLRSKTESLVRDYGADRLGYWVQHPVNIDELIWVEPSLVRTSKWAPPKPKEHAEISPDAGAGADADTNHGEAPKPDPARRGEHQRAVQWAATVRAGDQHSLVYATLPQGRSVHWASDASPHSGGLQLDVIRLSDITSATAAAARGQLPSPNPGDKHHPECRAYRVPPRLVEHVKYLVGTHGTSVVFLDHDGWLSTWDVVGPAAFRARGRPGTPPPAGRAGRRSIDSVLEPAAAGGLDIGGAAGGLTRHFFLPRDWLNTVTSHLAAVDGQGTLFCPHYGNVAIVRNGMRISLDVRSTSEGVMVVRELLE